MKIHIESICGAHETTGVPEGAAEAFMGEYQYGDAEVIAVPDGDPEVKHLITRTALYGATVSPDDEPEPEPEEPFLAEKSETEEPFLAKEPETEETDAEGGETTEESGTR